MRKSKKICGLYLRVSTEDQAREGFSLPEQRVCLEEYCKKRNYEIYDYYEDAGISAKKGNYRPAFGRVSKVGEMVKTFKIKKRVISTTKSLIIKLT